MYVITWTGHKGVRLYMGPVKNLYYEITASIDRAVIFDSQFEAQFAFFLLFTKDSGAEIMTVTQATNE